MQHQAPIHRPHYGRRKCEIRDIYPTQIAQRLEFSRTARVVMWERGELTDRIADHPAQHRRQSVASVWLRGGAFLITAHGRQQQSVWVNVIWWLNKTVLHVVIQHKRVFLLFASAVCCQQLACQAGVDEAMEP